MRRTLTYLLLILLLSACRTLNQDLPTNLSGEAPLVLGHGGKGFPSERNGIPANSMESIIRALEAEGADGVEIDVQLSSDSVAVLLHGANLKEETKCTGCPADLSWEEIRACRYANTLTARMGNYPLASLEEVMLRYQNWQPLPYLSLNVKVNTGCPGTDSQLYYRRLSREIIRLTRAYGWENRILIESPAIEFMSEFHALAPDLPAYLDGDLIADLDRLIDADLDGIVAKVQSFSPEEVAQFHAQGKGVVLYGIQLKKDVIDALEKGCDQMQVDDIRLTREVLKALGR